MREVISTDDAPGSPLYSQAVKVGTTIWVTGVPSIDPKTNQPIGTTIQEQTRQALTYCEKILAAAGATLDNVVEVQGLIAKPEDFAGQYDPMQVTAHKDAVSLFERYAKGGDDSKLKDWAGKTLPALQHHLEMAQGLDKNRR